MQHLEQERAVYARDLSGTAPTAYLVEKYLDFTKSSGRRQKPTHSTHSWFKSLPEARFGPRWPIAIADFSADSVLRKKLILVLALLKCAPPSFEALDRVPPGGLPGTIFRLAGASARFLAALIVGAAIFTPVRFWMARRWNAS